MVHHDRRSLIILLAAMFLGAFVGTAAAQSPTPINKCKVISKSGSYIVIQNLPNKKGLRKNDCLIIRANYVTIDLGGFVLQGTKKGDGITDDNKTRRSITVRNGTITNFKVGVNLEKTTEAVIRDLQAVDNSDDGIRAGKGCNISDNVASRNGGKGIYGDDGDCTVKDNVANSNDEDGLQLNEKGHTVSGNTADRNEGDGIQVDCPSNVIGNTAVQNDDSNLNEVDKGEPCVLSRNLAPEN